MLRSTRPRRYSHVQKFKPHARRRPVCSRCGRVIVGGGAKVGGGRRCYNCRNA